MKIENKSKNLIIKLNIKEALLIYESLKEMWYFPNNTELVDEFKSEKKLEKKLEKMLGKLEKSIFYIPQE